MEIKRFFHNASSWLHPKNQHHLHPDEATDNYKIRRSETGTGYLTENSKMINQEQLGYLKFHEKIGLETLPVFIARNEKLLLQWGGSDEADNTLIATDPDVQFTDNEAATLAQAKIQVGSLSMLSLAILTSEKPNGFELEDSMAASIMGKIKHRYTVADGTRKGSVGSGQGSSVDRLHHTLSKMKTKMNKKKIKADKIKYRDVILHILLTEFSHRYKARWSNNEFNVRPNKHYIGVTSGISANGVSTNGMSRGEYRFNYINNNEQFVNRRSPSWVPDSSAHGKQCHLCNVEFKTLICARHHCRRCGNTVCTPCSRHRVPRTNRDGTSKAMRVCDACKPTTDGGDDTNDSDTSDEDEIEEVQEGVHECKTSDRTMKQVKGMKVDENETNEDVVANTAWKVEQQNPHPKHMLSDSSTDFQKCETDLNDRWELEIRSDISKVNYEYIVPVKIPVDTEKQDFEEVKLDLIVAGHLVAMKTALSQLRKRLYSMLKGTDDDTLSMAICARNWDAVKLLCQPHIGGGNGTADGNIFLDTSCHNRYPLQNALEAGAPFEVVKLLIERGGTTPAEADWASGRGYHTPLLILHRQGRLTKKVAGHEEYKVWKYKDALTLKTIIWSNINDDKQSLSTACFLWMWDAARVQLLLDDDRKLQPGQKRATNTPDVLGIYPFAHAINAQPVDKKHEAPKELICRLIVPLTDDEGEDIRRSGLILTHQIGPWFVSQPELFSEVLKRFWRLMDSHQREIRFKSGAGNSNDKTNKQKGKRMTLDQRNNGQKRNTLYKNKKVKSRRRNGIISLGIKKKHDSISVVVVPAEVAQLSAATNVAATVKSVDKEDKDQMTRGPRGPLKMPALRPSPPSTHASSSTSVAASRSTFPVAKRHFVDTELGRNKTGKRHGSIFDRALPPALEMRDQEIKKLKKYYQHFVADALNYNDHTTHDDSIAWSNTLPCRLPILFRPSSVSAKGNVDLEVTSKLLFVLYASLFEELNRVRLGKKTDPNRIQLIGEAARCGKNEFIRLQKHALKEAGIKSSGVNGNIFDMPLREIGRVLWSRSRKVAKVETRSDMWFYNIQRKDDEMMQMMLEQFQGRAGTFLTTPLGFALRVGSYHCCRELVKHRVSSPTAVCSYLNLDENWKDRDIVEDDSSTTVSQFESIRDGLFYPPQYIHTQHQYGLSAYEIVIVSKDRARDSNTVQLFEKILAIFRQNPQVQLNNRTSACNRTMRFRNGIPELVIVLMLIAVIAYRYSSLWGGVSTQQFASHFVDKFTGNTFSEDHQDFFDISNVNDYYDWLKGPFIGELYGQRSTLHSSHLSLEGGTTLIAGPVRLRQLRLKQQSCDNSLGLDAMVLGDGRCLVESSNDINRWSRTSFGPNNMFKWEDQAANISMTPSWLGLLQENYLGSAPSSSGDTKKTKKEKQLAACSSKLCQWRNGLQLHGHRDFKKVLSTLNSTFLLIFLL